MTRACPVAEATRRSAQAGFCLREAPPALVAEDRANSNGAEVEEGRSLPFSIESAYAAGAGRLVVQAAEEGMNSRKEIEEQPSGTKQAAEKWGTGEESSEKHTSGAKAPIDSAGFMPGLKSRPTARTSFSAACKARVDSAAPIPGLKSRLTARTSFSAACEAAS